MDRNQISKRVSVCVYYVDLEMYIFQNFVYCLCNFQFLDLKKKSTLSQCCCLFSLLLLFLLVLCCLLACIILNFPCTLYSTGTRVSPKTLTSYAHIAFFCFVFFNGCFFSLCVNTSLCFLCILCICSIYSIFVIIE